MILENNVKHATEPLFHISKRAPMPLKKSLHIRVGAGVAAFLLCALLCTLMTGANPLTFLVSFWNGLFFGTNIWTFLKEFLILLGLAVAITPAFKMKFWNIGAEGQALVGVLASIAVAFYTKDILPVWLMLPLMLLASIIASAIWALVPAIFKAKWGTNETLFTLMMNYVAVQLVKYVLALWTKKDSMNALSDGWLPKIPDASVIPLIIVLLVTGAMFVYMNYTKQGYELSVVGESENTARYIGINVNRVIMRTMIISGALCGLVGFLIASGFDAVVNADSIGGRGFTAIMISWLAQFNPLIMIGSAGLIAFLERGADEARTVLDITKAFPDMVIGIVLFFLIGCEFFIRYEIKFRKSKKEEGSK